MTTKKKKATEWHSADEVFTELGISGPLTFAQLLETSRLCEEWSQAEAARRLGITRHRLHDYEKGVRLPSSVTAWRCAEVFGMSPEHWVSVVFEEQLRRYGLNLRVTVEQPETPKGNTHPGTKARP